MVSDNSPHADLMIRCGARLTDDDGEPVLNEHGNQTICDTEMVGSQHAEFVKNPHGEDRHGNDLQKRFVQDALKFTCPDCGAVTYTCPACADSQSPGWFRGESTGDMIPCHNCNQDEVRRQRRQRGRFRPDGGRSECRLPGIPKTGGDR